MQKAIKRICILILILGFCFAIPLTAKDNEDILIENFIFGRFSIHFQIDSKISNFQVGKIVNRVKKNILWSGFYRLSETKKNVDVVLKIDKLSNSTVKLSILSSEEEFYSKDISIYNGEKEFDQIVKLIVFQLTGQESLLGNAIVYAEKGNFEGYRLVLTDPLNENHKVVLDDGNLNILPRWNPKGEKILFTALEKRKNNLKIFNFKTSKISFFNKNPRFNYSGGTWDPNNENLVMTLSRNGNSDIYNLSPEGKILKRLTHRSSIESNPRISPDGDRMVFVSNRTGRIHIYQKILDNGKIIRVTYEGRLNVEPAWSSDGAHIVFASMRKKRYQIFIMDNQGDYIKQLTSGKSSSEQPLWSPNGRQILFASKVRGDYKLFLMDVDGTHKRRLTKTGKGIGEFNASWTANFDWKNVRL